MTTITTTPIVRLVAMDMTIITAVIAETTGAMIDATTVGTIAGTTAAANRQPILCNRKAVPQSTAFLLH